MKTEFPDILGNPAIQMAARANDSKARMRAQIADAIISTKTWGDMNKKERKLCIDYAVSQSVNETELRVHLTEMDVGYVAIDWHDTDPNDKVALEAQMLIQALGGTTAKNGALVSVSTMDDFD